MSTVLEPFFRSRTSLFLSYRDSAASSVYHFNSYNPFGDNEEEHGLLGEIDLEIGRTQNPPRWVDISDKAERIISSISPKLERLDKLQARHLLPGFKDRSAEEKEIESLSREITKDLRTSQSHIQEIAQLSSTLLSNTGPETSTSASSRRIDMIMAANVQMALAAKIQDISAVFRKKQSEYLRRLKNIPGHGQRFGFSGLDGSVSPISPTSSVIGDDSNLMTSQISSSSHIIDQRTNEINGLAQSISDLASMFKDLGAVVIDQGTLLDRIDWNVEQMAGDVRESVKELNVASKYQKRSNKCLFIFFLMLLIFGAFIVLFFRPRGSFVEPPVETAQIYDSAKPIYGPEGETISWKGVQTI